MKLNLKRTCLIGFAFFGILLLWQIYDSWCPTFLTDIFAQNMYSLTSAELKAGDSEKILNVQWLVGIIMACDNLAALVLLPIFGKLSDRTHSPIGKRMPYILVGTFVSAVSFPFIPLLFHKSNFVGMIAFMAVVIIFMMMSRNPAVALMPDITPKPLRTKANGIINIMGYIGGAMATVLGIFLPLSDYINVANRADKLWIIEIPFVAASVLMVISALVLFCTVKENRLEAELADEMAKGEALAQTADTITDDGKLSKKNRNMLLAILGAEMLWFMADNAVGTYIGNYVIYYLNSKSSATMILTIAGGAASVAGFAVAGYIADIIGRKHTVCLGLILSFAALAVMAVIKPSSEVVGANGELAFPAFLYAIWLFKGFGMSLVHNCSFPMVVELCSSKHIGKFTGYYYTASMLAQTLTPVLVGLILFKYKLWYTLPIYAAILTLLSAAVFGIFVKNIGANKNKNAKGLEALE